MRKNTEGKKETKNKSNIGTELKCLMLLVLIIITTLGIYLGTKYEKPTHNNEMAIENDIEVEETIAELPEEKTVKIFSGTDRPIACMIDNHSDAWPQFKINEAYAVYEIIVEGGETRLMAVFKGSNADKVGPMRSARHYFLDYALENDALYAHIGQSPEAENDIYSLGINNINGITYDSGRTWQEGDVFWRLNTRYAPHNCVCDLNQIKATASSLNYLTLSNKESVLNYVVDEVKLDEKEDSIDATDVTIPFSTLQTVNFKYDEETGRYTRYARNQVQIDASDDSNITTKNIIITKVRNYDLNDGENKGRQTIENIGTKDGYYITNGKAIPIQCIKTSRSAQTVYQDLEGNEIEVNDGNTFFEICPIDANIVIE